MNQSSILQPPDRQRVDEQIATSIADAILDGVFPPGSALPPERELAEQLGVNRTSLRQGLARLQQMGLIETRQGSGNVVRDPQSLTHPAVVEALVRKLGPDFLVEVLEIRAALGPLIGRLAAERNSSEDAEALRAALAEVADADTAPARQAADLAYFRVLIHGTRNRALGLLYRWVEQAFGGREHELTGAYEDADPVIADLTAINDAVLAGDPETAAAAVEGYLNASALRMIMCYRAAYAGEDPER
ncbi:MULTISPECIES: FadR/GntR family transcriptional regulator [Mycobacterium ulcerans group]|uniref:Transcriptional regulatory protein (Probably GntR-family) n=2 Tax=Mycobacterium ulcerans group TaxID=2993898 RepID=B2HQW0_MYCMM|nr:MULTISPECIES: FadR/GntR family transcriptional regulator [Mycobacterium ulcerans group]ACC39280.1 transcriptional regulatory protein (probably GntR-family) [Mycobacterium marinum M]EPQ71589.1 Lactate-responsive regulator [Mycobacterium marinum MB2]MDC9007965.1 FadR/GntR family transcriptional regulator [Mycobacterium marinum]RFZ62575.1 HTH-type transcriptional regulator Mce2R [Mycobacterium marinum]BAV43177.1 GntR family transcriptional regulator [Mycobacterium ulcerans subsp. shinshuense]